MIERLHDHFGDSYSYVITGAPQCPLDDAWFQMKAMIVAAKFDILFIQFYNNEGCDAVGEGFNYDNWTSFLRGTESAHAQLYIGLLSYPGSGYVEPSDLKALIDVYGTRPNFGGVSLWDEYYAVRTRSNVTGKTYLEAVQDALATVTPTATIPSYIPTGTPTCAIPYTVQEGDNCYSIADKYVATVDQILAQNPDLDAFCDVVPGELICLPPTATTTRSPTPTPTVACARTYIVQPLDYCYKIADAVGLTYDELIALNPQLDANCDLSPGDMLCIEGASTSSSSGASQATTTTSQATTTTSQAMTTATAAPTCTEEYTVQPSDYCYKIATEAGISVSELLSYNPSLDSDCDINPGDVLCIGVGSKTTTTSSTTAVIVATTAPFTNSTITAVVTMTAPFTNSTTTAVITITATSASVISTLLE